MSICNSLFPLYTAVKKSNCKLDISASLFKVKRSECLSYLSLRKPRRQTFFALPSFFAANILFEQSF